MLRVAFTVVYGVLAILAVLTARRDRAHRPVAAYVAWMFLSELVRWAGLIHLYRDAPRPLHGVARLAFHVDEAIALSWSGFFVAACLAVFVGRGVRYAFVGWLAIVGLVCVWYPRLSGPSLVNVYLATSALSTVVAWSCIVYGVFFRRDLRPGLGALVLILYAATDVAIYLFNYVRGFLQNWPFANLAGMLMLTAAIVAHVVWLARHRRLRTA